MIAESRVTESEAIHFHQEMPEQADMHIIEPRYVEQQNEADLLEPDNVTPQEENTDDAESHLGDPEIIQEGSDDVEEDGN